MVLELPVLYFLRCTDCIFHAIAKQIYVFYTIEIGLFAPYIFDLWGQDGYWNYLHVIQINLWMDFCRRFTKFWKYSTRIYTVKYKKEKSSLKLSKIQIINRNLKASDQKSQDIFCVKTSCDLLKDDEFLVNHFRYIPIFFFEFCSGMFLRNRYVCLETSLTKM